jgi:hypothetical protein
MTTAEKNQNTINNTFEHGLHRLAREAAKNKT